MQCSQCSVQCAVCSAVHVKASGAAEVTGLAPGSGTAKGIWKPCKTAGNLNKKWSQSVQKSAKSCEYLLLSLC